MDSERRYTDAEVDRILDRATEVDAERGSEAESENTPGARDSGDSAGLTLRDLHEIGKEVGIPEEVITHAATSLNRPGPSAPPTTQAFLGQTIGVGRTVELPRTLTDQEWNLLVVDLRETFDAKGKISDDGAFRQWTNNNLQALLEPTETGQRLRLRTVKGNARPNQAMGAVLMIGTLGMGIPIFLSGGQLDIFPLFGVVGAALFFGSRLMVPKWARRRSRQFEDIIARLIQRLDAAAIESGDPPADDRGA